ncbi:hypothetical protein J2W79_000296 [Methylorubrum extorquens]|nr:hypothetical protein [Methylorubrum extorquens]
MRCVWPATWGENGEAALTVWPGSGRLIAGWTARCHRWIHKGRALINSLIAIFTV